MRQYQIPAWKQAPFLRLLLPFCSGILLAYYLNPTGYLISALWIFIFLGLIIFRLMPLAQQFQCQALQGILLTCLLLLSAMQLTHQADVRNNPYWFGHIHQAGDSIRIRIKEPLQEKEKSFQTTASIISVRNDQQWVPVNGNIVVYLSKDAAPSKLQPGVELCFSREPNSILHSGNPGSFDYARYASRLGIFHSIYLKSADWKYADYQPPPLPVQFILHLRKKILQVMEEHFHQDSSIQGVAEALLIGYKDHLNTELVQEYAQAGVVHIIAISGLHLGLIYWVITTVLARLPFTRKRPAVQYLLSLVSLWLFALLTGASASVLRSAVMFTCMLFGKMLSKKTTIYQSLSASAFLLLAWNPYLLWDAGFQLSYLALAGIVFLQRPIQNWMYIPNRWLRYVWNMLTVTIAAQIGTMAICLFYFHQFPTYFFVTNLIAVPVSTLILFLDMALLLFNGCSAIADILALGCRLAIQWMNNTITAVNDIPGSLITGIYADTGTTIFLHLLLIGVLTWLILSQKKWLWLSLTASLGFTLMHALAEIKTIHRKQVILYNIQKHTALDFVSETHYSFYADDNILQNENLLHRYLNPARISMKLTEADDNMQGLEKKGQLIRFNGMTIMHLNKSMQFAGRLPVTCKIDMVLVSGNPQLSISGLHDALHPSIIVFDPSNSLWKIAEWKRACRIVPLPCFSIPERGARIISCGDPLPDSFFDR